MIKRNALLVTITVLFGSFSVARADDNYYMIVFGQQDRVNSVSASHTFATFVKATGTGSDKSKYVLASHTISWMPRSLNVEIFAGPEEGVNLTLKESIEQAQSIGASVTMFGPYEIKKDLYDRAVKQQERLKQGEVAYTVLDLFSRSGSATNCIHAVSDIDSDRGLLQTGASRGNDASLLVLGHLARWLKDRDAAKNQWLKARLDIGAEVSQKAVRFAK